MYRVTQNVSWILSIFPLFIVLLIAILAALGKIGSYVALFILILFILSTLSTNAKYILVLSDIKIKNNKIFIKKSIGINFEVVDFKNAINVEYYRVAQEIFGKFSYLEEASNKIKYAHFWPIRTEAKWDTSKLYMICVYNGTEEK
jgi:hypothetical protein